MIIMITVVGTVKNGSKQGTERNLGASNWGMGNIGEKEADSQFHGMGGSSHVNVDADMGITTAFISVDGVSRSA